MKKKKENLMIKSHRDQVNQIKIKMIQLEKLQESQGMIMVKKETHKNANNKSFHFQSRVLILISKERIKFQYRLIQIGILTTGIFSGQIVE